MQPPAPATTLKNLRTLAMFTNLDVVHLRRIADGCHHRTLDRGEYLFHRGAASRSFYGVNTGLMELALTNAHGEKKVLEIISPGQSLGEAVMFLQRPYPVDARALAKTTLTEVPATVINQLIDDDPRFARAMLASMSLRLHNRVRDIEMFTLATAKQRLIGFLLGQLADQRTGPHLINTTGLGEYVNHVPVDHQPAHPSHTQTTRRPHQNPTPTSFGTITLPTAKATIASRLGMTPETFSRALTALIDDGLIHTEGRHIHITDIDALTASAEN